MHTPSPLDVFKFMSANVNAIERNGTQYVPLKETVEELGGSVRWDNESKSATVNVKQSTAMLDANSTTIMVNGQQKSLSATPILEDGHLYVTMDTLTALGLTFGTQ